MQATPVFEPSRLLFELQDNSNTSIINEMPSQDALFAIVQQSIEHVLHNYDIDFINAEITLRLVDAAEGQELNRQFRHKDYATNVLTFEYGTDEYDILRADIVICLPVLQQEAQEQGKSFKDHFSHLLVHGVLHALGFDHESDEEAEEMEALEVEILSHFQIKNPY